MNAPPLPLTRDLVLLGGGHTHALFLRMWGMKPLPGVRLTVVNPDPTAAYSGMLPGFVAGHYDRHDLSLDLVRLARFAGARLVLGAADGIELASKTLCVPGRPPIGYDVLSVDIGITSAMPGLPGFAMHGVPAKPLGTFARRWNEFRATAQDARIAVIGAGAAGAELAMAMAHALRDRGGKVTLIDRDEAAARILAGAHAMTDVTGFGLAGHLAGICEASGTAAELRLEDIPLMPGAEALAAGGTRSTLYKDNRDGAGPVPGAVGARGDLLFDPQTAGGLLAAVPADAAPGLLAALKAARYPAAIIGQITAGAGPIKVI